MSPQLVRVLLSEVSASAFGPALLETHQGIELVSMRSDGSLSLGGGDQLERDAAEIEVACATSDLLGDGPIRPFFGLVRRATTLRWFQSQAAGFDAPFFGELIRRGVLFTKSDVHSIPIAEYVLRAALDHAQRPERWAAASAERHWEPHEFDELWGTTWLVVGFGSIGAEVARRAEAFGALVIGVRRHPRGDEPAAEMVPPERLPGVLGRADVVVLSAPANASSSHLVDAGFLAAMKPGSLLVNVGRGSVVDEAALLAALDSGPIGAAVLDVFETEPLPADSPLWDHPLVTVTPHSSALSRRRFERQAELFSDNLGRYLRGAPLRGVVTEADLD